MKFLTLIVLALLTLTSCIEIIDDISLNTDGSGTFKYSINLSSSKVKINSVLALDSLDGRKVPSREEIAAKIETFKTRLIDQEGISGVEVEADFSNYLFKVKCNFKNIDRLQAAIKNVASSFSEKKDIEELKHNWMSREGNSFVRSIPELNLEQTKRIKEEDNELLKQGSYTSITRFETEVERFDNPKAILSKNKMAVMIKTNPYTLINNPNVLDNRIYF